MSIAAVVFTDGRDHYLDQTLDSFDRRVAGTLDLRLIWDDTGDDDHRAMLDERYPGWVVGNRTAPRRGFGGAIRTAWQALRAVDVEHVFHFEDDFLFERTVNLDQMARVLDTHPYLAQMALRRQPWGPAEEAVGGVVEQHPDAYDDVHAGLDHWLEHRLFHTTNPSLFRRALLEVGWPDAARSEGVFTCQLRDHGFAGVEGGALRFGYWGRRTDPPWVRHIGAERVGVGY